MAEKPYSMLVYSVSISPILVGGCILGLAAAPTQHRTGRKPLQVMRREDGVTRNPIARGKLTVSQPCRGYRFNIDSVILAGFACPPARRVCDLGTGSGIVGMWLAKEGAEEVMGVEIQPILAELARCNSRDNGLERVFRVVECDIRRFGLDGHMRFEQLVSNPPFSPLGRGRVDADPTRAIARHEIYLRLRDLLEAAQRLLAPGGRFDLVHRADREEELLREAGAAGLAPCRLRRVLPKPSLPPSRVLLEFRLASRPGEGGRDQTAPRLVVEPPLVLHEEDGSYSPEVARLLGD